MTTPVAAGDGSPLTEDEWLHRYEARFIAVGVSAQAAAAMRRAENFETLSECYEDDPEGAADMEMSYWSE